MRMNERRPLPSSGVCDRTHKGRIRRNRIGTVDFLEMEIRETRDETRNISAGGLNFYRYRDCVLVVFHYEDQRQLEIGGGVHRLPELAFAGRALAEGDIGHLIA